MPPEVQTQLTLLVIAALVAIIGTIALLPKYMQQKLEQSRQLFEDRMTDAKAARDREMVEITADVAEKRTLFSGMNSQLTVMNQMSRTLIDMSGDTARNAIATAANARALSGNTDVLHEVVHDIDNIALAIAGLPTTAQMREMVGKLEQVERMSIRIINKLETQEINKVEGKDDSTT